MYGIRLPLGIGFVCFVAICPAASVAADPPPKVDIRSEDGKVLIAADQIRSYEWTTHTLTLMPKVREALTKRLPPDRIVSGIPFAVAVGGKAVYKGKFTTVVSSMSFSTPMVVVDAQGVEPKLETDKVRIQLGYPSPDFFKGEDPRGDPRIQEALKATGKLANADDKGADPKITEIRLERSQGKESGPQDVLTLGADGTATYEGKKNVERLGRFQGKLGDHGFHEPFPLLTQMYVSLRELGGVSTGKPTESVTVVTLTVVRNGKREEIVDLCPGIDERLWALEMAIRGVGAEVAWKKTTEK